MKIAVDAMSGDFAPQEIVKGALKAATELGIKIILVGHAEQVRQELAKYLTVPESVEVYHSAQVIDMQESPTTAMRKRDASMVIAAEMLKQKEVQAMITAGNTAAAMLLAVAKLGKISGINRPAIATILPNPKGYTILLDVGANVDCTPQNLLQFALIGDLYAKRVLSISQPRAGLLSIGEEKSKGNKLTKRAYKLLEEADIHFIGNVEGKDLFTGAVDVVVCDGFTGNVALKVGEGYAEFAYSAFGEELERERLPSSVVLERLKSKMDYAEYGGAPLLGVEGIFIISHGRSNSKAIANAIRVAQRCFEANIVENLRAAFPAERK